MKEPQRIPLNPSAPRAKSVKLTPLKQLTLFDDDIDADNVMPDNDSIYIRTTNINENLKESTET